ALTGLRRGEMRRMDWSWIDLDAKTLTVKESKSGRLRTIPLPKPAVAILDGLEVQEGPVKGNWGDLLDSNGRLYYFLRTLAMKAGVRRFGLHALRHTFCTNLLIASKNVFAVEK